LREYRDPRDHPELAPMTRGSLAILAAVAVAFGALVGLGALLFSRRTPNLIRAAVAFGLLGLVAFGPLRAATAIAGIAHHLGAHR
jgi:hypothetical protein